MNTSLQRSFRSLLRFSLKTITFSLLLAKSQQAFGQFTDNFADGDFASNPVWAGTDSKFIVSSSRLKLQAPAATDNAYLAVSSASINDASWEFFVRLEFNPSSSNFARVYLVSDHADLSGSLNGYFVGVGNASDEISLYRQTGSTSTEIIDGLDNRLNLATADVKIKVTRDANGLWHLYSDVGLTGSYSTEGSVNDATYFSSSYSGIYCVYTATRSDKFYFDDFDVSGNPYQDHDKPVLQNLSVLSATELLLTFSEPLDEVNAEDLTHFEISGSNAISSLLQSDPSQIKVTFGSAFPNGYESTLKVFGITDLGGNQIDMTEKSFLYFQSSPVSYRDVIITEFFPDFTPKIGLPEAEFVEIYNRSTNPIDLANWIITDGNSIGVLPSKIILPGNYIILSSSSAQLFFSDFGQTVSVSNFPTLNNNGDRLTLKDWYRDEDKAQGGWTIERIDPENVCAGDDNWSPSVDESGGTPGRRNSINATIVDDEPPHSTNFACGRHNRENLFQRKARCAIT